MKTILECSSLTKNYGSFTALNNVNLKLSKGKSSACSDLTEAVRQLS